jgi:fucose permease
MPVSLFCKMKREVDLIPIATAYASYVTLGASVGLRGVAWPSIRATFGLPLDAIGVWLIAATASSTLSSFSGGLIASIIGVGPLLLIGSLTATLGLLSSGAAPAWWALVLAGLLSGLGGGTIHTGLNAHFAANRGVSAMNWLHACFGIGATLGPLMMTAILKAGLSWRWAYGVAGAGMGLLGISFALTTKRWHGSTENSARAERQEAFATSRLNTLRLPIVWLSLLLFCTYVGVESTAGQWAYSLFTEARFVTEEVASFWMSVYWGGLAGGRLLLGSLADRVGVVPLLRLCMLCVILGAALVWWHTTDTLSFLGLALMGLAEGPVFPSLMSDTPRRVSTSHVDNTVGFQVAAASLGSAALSSLAGVLAERDTLETVGPFLLLCSLALFILHEVTVRLTQNAGLQDPGQRQLP